MDKIVDPHRDSDYRLTLQLNCQDLNDFTIKKSSQVKRIQLHQCQAGTVRQLENNVPQSEALYQPEVETRKTQWS